MSLQIEIALSVPVLTAQIARAAFPKGHSLLTMRDELGTFFEDQQFADLFPPQGPPAEAPWRLALVTLLQFAENLSDRQAADAVRSRIDWKYALGLEMTDPGFDYTVLCQFRARLLAGHAEDRLLEALLTRFTERGLFKARGRQRTDSTHVVARIRLLNRLSCVGEAMRATLNTLAIVAPEWLQVRIEPDWAERYSLRFEEHRLPSTEPKQKELAHLIGADGYRLLSALYEPATPEWLRQIPEVDLLRRVWVQQYTRPGEDTVVLRDEADMPPAAVRIASVYDPDARYSTKRSMAWTGYKVHLTETCEADTPSLITHVETTPATTPDAQVVEGIHEALAQHDRLPNRHWVDAAYVDAERLVSSQERGVDLYGPVPRDGSWQAQAGTGFDSPHFTVDWAARQVTCPQGRTSRIWKPTKDRHGKAVIHVAFEQSDCAICPSRSACTRSEQTGREMTLRPQFQHEALQTARQRQQTEEFKEEYAVRSGIEGTLSQGIRAFGLRRCRYIGQAKTHLQHLVTAAAMNLVRVIAWLGGIPRESTRQSSFARLVKAT